MRPMRTSTRKGLDMPRSRSKASKSCNVSITPGAAEQLRAIQKEYSSDPAHVLRIEAESQGFSLWLGPEVAGDVIVGSEDTYQLRVSSEQAEHMAGENLIVDFWRDCSAGPRLIIYREEEPPPHLRSPRGHSGKAESGRQKKGVGTRRPVKRRKQPRQRHTD